MSKGFEKERSWLALGGIEGIGCHTYKNLLLRFKTPDNCFRASLKELLEVEGMSQSLARRIKSFDNVKEVEKELSLLKRWGVKLVTLADDNYPSNLKEIYDPPPYLYVKGTLLEEDKAAFAIVGSRYATPYGLGVAQRIAMELASCGLTIVSGMARGIDSEAHRGALRAKGRTIAVLGSGIDVVYPPEAKRLYEEIAENGAVITEFPFRTPPRPGNFPKRNRVISGLSLGVLVIEASLKSGSLITARLALEQGRDVFAIPGSITSYTSQGTNKLIREGAKLVEKVEDIVEEILPFLASKREGEKVGGAIKGEKEETPLNIPLTEEEERIYRGLTEPKHIDIIIEENNLSPGAASALLLSLEIKGLISQQPGKVFSRCQNP